MTTFCLGCLQTITIQCFKTTYADKAGIPACKNIHCPKPNCRCGSSCKCGEDTGVGSGCGSAKCRKEGKLCASKRDCDVSVESLKQYRIHCTECRRQSQFSLLREFSPASRRFCNTITEERMVEGNVNCLLCGILVGNNRVCPSCVALYCHTCLEQWSLQNRELQPIGKVSCAHCRSVHLIEDFSHDRFIAKVARLLSFPKSTPQRKPIMHDEEIGAQSGRTDDSHCCGGAKSRSPSKIYTMLKRCIIFFSFCIFFMLAVGLCVFKLSSEELKTQTAKHMSYKNCVGSLPAEADFLKHGQKLMSAFPNAQGSFQHWVNNEIQCSIAVCANRRIHHSPGGVVPWLWAPCGWQPNSDAHMRRLKDVQAAISVLNMSADTVMAYPEVMEAIVAIDIRLGEPNTP